MKVFLGGTCNDSTWREELIPKLKINYFNPVVDDWNEEAQKRELMEKKSSDFQLFVITPKMTGVFSIAEVVDASNKNPAGTIFCVLDFDNGEIWSTSQRASLLAVENLVRSNGAFVFESLDETSYFLNQYSGGFK